MDGRDAGWRRAEDHCRERLRADPSFDVAGYFYDNRLDWIRLIKSLRTLRGVGLFEAQKEALRNQRWHAWVLHRIESDPVCAKQVRAHLRQYGEAALIKLSGS